MKVDGRCHCGRITFEAEVDPEKVLICHCTDCQSLSGAPYRTVVRVPHDNFRLKSGKPKEYVKQADSGNRLVMAFCGDCGSPIYGAHAGDHPPFYGIRVGTLRQRDKLPPKLQIWCRSELDWAGDTRSLPRIEKHG
jgi:hypothetical protein